MSKTLAKQLLLSNNYWVLNKNMVKIFGLEAAFILSNFAEAESMMADEDGWFYQTAETVEKMTTLSRHKQDQCIEQLEKQGVLEKEVRGMPAKRYFRINYKCLTNLFVNNSQTSMRKINKLVCKKSATSKESINKELINKEQPIVEVAVPYQKIKELFNETCTSLSKIRSLSDIRRKHIRARWKQLDGDINIFKEAFALLEKSSFCKGDNNRGWRADFDWIIGNDNNILKVLEGKYADKSTSHKQVENKRVEETAQQMSKYKELLQQQGG